MSTVSSRTSPAACQRTARAVVMVAWVLSFGRSANQGVDVVSADPHLVVVLPAQSQVVVHVEVPVAVAVLVEPDQRTGHHEEAAHRLIRLVRHEGVPLPRGLVDRKSVV